MTLTHERAGQLDLAPMVGRSTDPQGTAFTVSVDHVSNSTGISAPDRAATVTALADPTAQPGDFRRPGHIFPLVARPGGVLRRAGHTEAGCDLARLAGFAPARVICEIMGDDGEMSRLPDLLAFGDTVTGAEHVALVMGEVTPGPLLVRVHSECLTGDGFHSLRCDCGPQRDAAMRAIADEGRGVLIYLRQEGRGAASAC